MTKATQEIAQNGKGLIAPVAILQIKEGFNPRDKAEPDQQLIDSIKKHGVMHPILVRNDPEKPGWYDIIDGERRYKAAKKAGVKEVPVVPEGELDDTEALVYALISNEGQVPLSTLEKAKAFKRLTDADADEGEIAKSLSIHIRTVKEILRVLDNADEEIKKGAAAKDKKDKIPTRVAARASELPKSEQKAIAGKLRGKGTKAGLKEVQKRERELKQKRRGRKPRLTPIARDAHARLDMLYYLVVARLRNDPTDARALAHLELTWVLQGEREVVELYDGNGKEAKRVAKIGEVRSLIRQLDELEAMKASAEREPAPKKSKKTAKVQKRGPAKKTPKKTA